MDRSKSLRPFALHLGEPLPTMSPPACIYDPREQRCVFDGHHRIAAQTNPMQDNTGSDYTPWTGDEGGP